MPMNQEFVISTLNYLALSETKPKSYIDPPEDGTPVSRPKQETHEVQIYDSRELLNELSLDRQGFEIVPHESKVSDFYDEDEVRSAYYPEVAELVKQATGGERVVVFDHNVRNARKANDSKISTRQPVRYVHNDYTILSGPQRVRDMLSAADAEDMLQNRFAVINVWRPIRGPVQDSPLAVCDARSIRRDDFVPTDLIYHDRTGEVYSVRHNPDHRWYYVSDMQPGEAMLLKCYDSEQDGRARFTAHSAFQNPDCPPDAIARESIEARALVFFASDH